MRKLTFISAVLLLLLVGSPAVMSYPCNCVVINGIEICNECAPPDATSVNLPEPSTLALLGLGFVGLVLRKVYQSRKK